MPGGLSTDLYELNMAASYLRRGMDGLATFSLYVRDMPKQRGFLVSAGLEDCLRFLESFVFDEDELAYLKGIGFDQRAKPFDVTSIDCLDRGMKLRVHEILREASVAIGS